jgi:ribosome biogenesis protein ENP2
VSADSKGIKIWNGKTGAVFSAIEPAKPLNDFAVCPNSGLIMTAVEGHQLESFYVPQLGVAPRWCAFLDNLTEEMAEQTTKEAFDDYKFVTREQLHEWGCDHFVGTALLRAVGGASALVPFTCVLHKHSAHAISR